MVEVVFVPVAFTHTIFWKVDGVAPVRTTLVKVALVAIKFVVLAFTAKKFVVVALVAVVLVKIPVDGVILPIGVPSIDPPEIDALEELKLVEFKVTMVPVSAFTVVPEAVAKPNQAVEVPLVKLRFSTVPFVRLPLTANKLVEVAEIPFKLV